MLRYVLQLGRFSSAFPFVSERIKTRFVAKLFSQCSFIVQDSFCNGMALFEIETNGKKNISETKLPILDVKDSGMLNNIVIIWKLC